jgi:DhnA family fructose-bisphosphate aldolase class Ia
MGPALIPTAGPIQRPCSCPMTKDSSTARGTFFPNPDASDPKYVIGLALEGGFNGIAIQIGLAEKFYWDYAGEVPLVLKLNARPTFRLPSTRCRR